MDVHEKLREIFKEHCNLSIEQFKVLREMLVDMVSDVETREPEEVVQGDLYDLEVIIDFLNDTGELRDSEAEALNEYAESIAAKAEEDED